MTFKELPIGSYFKWKKFLKQEGVDTVKYKMSENQFRLKGKVLPCHARNARVIPIPADKVIRIKT